MEVRRFRHFTRIQCSWIFTLGFGLIWAFLNFDLSGDDYEYYDERVELRYVEREILHLEAGRDRGLILEWLTNQADREKTFGQLKAILVDHSETERVRELQRYLETPESEREIFSAEEQEIQLRRSLWAELPWFLAFGGALVAIWIGCRDWKDGGRTWRMTAAWAPSTVLIVFFITELFGNHFLYDAAAEWVYLFFGDDWGMLLSNLLWRASPALLAALALIGSWGGIVRVFGLKQAVRWRAVLGAFCVLSVYQSLQLWVGGESDSIDPSDFLEVADPHSWDLIFDVMDGVVFAPVFEEVMFRGVLFMMMARRLGPVLAGAISTTLFAVIHTQYDPWGILSVGVFGLACCWLTWRTGSIKSSIVLHMIYNGLITAWVYVVYQMPL